MFGAPPKIVRLEKMDYSTKIAAMLIRRYPVAIAELAKGGNSVLVLRRT
jgi:hypothetical protein